MTVTAVHCCLRSYKATSIPRDHCRCCREDSEWRDRLPKHERIEKLGFNLPVQRWNCLPGYFVLSADPASDKRCAAVYAEPSDVYGFHANEPPRHYRRSLPKAISVDGRANRPCYLRRGLLDGCQILSSLIRVCIPRWQSSPKSRNCAR